MQGHRFVSDISGVAEPGADLVIVAISGVQRFIAESRSTADLRAGSVLMSELATVMRDVVRAPAEVIIPAADTGPGAPNRVAAAVPAGEGRVLAEAMAQAVRRAWQKQLAEAFRGVGAAPPRALGFPAVQWVVAQAGTDGYRGQWQRAQDALASRKRVRDFPAHDVAQAKVCSLTGRWAALPEEDAPTSAYNVRRNEALSAVGYVKRWHGRRRGSGFPSTMSVATAPFREAIIRHGEEHAALWDAVASINIAFEALCESHEGAAREALRRGSGILPGMSSSSDEALTWLRETEGAWCAAETWDPDGLRRDYDLAAAPDRKLCADGRTAAGRLAHAAGNAGISPMTPYLAVLAQDADHMGEKLSDFRHAGADPRGWHQRISQALGAIAGRQRTEIESAAHLGQVVYAGGDDLLALVPADKALAAARQVNEMFAKDDELAAAFGVPPSASTVVVFFHASWPLQSAIAAAQHLLKDAKERTRPGLGVAVLNRGGQRARVVLPWYDSGAATGKLMIGHLETLAEAISGPLSGRLAAGLETDRVALAELSRDWLVRELTRRASRQGIIPERAPAVGAVLAALCGAEPGERGFIDCADSVVIARFLAAQTRMPS
jgi:CRISPR-associated protein